METRNIYFVRHGQTDANVSGIAQSNESQLTEEGKKQARILAKRFENISIDHVITSELIRAIDTGKEITLNRKIQSTQTDLLNERIKPSSVMGLDHADDKYKDFLDSFLSRATEIDYRYEDGENFYDILQRIRSLLSFIETETSGDVVVVTHGIVMRILVTLILTNSTSMEVYVEGFKNLHIDNTGITHVKLNNNHWRFGTINDSTHLS